MSENEISDLLGEETHNTEETTSAEKATPSIRQMTNNATPVLEGAVGVFGEIGEFLFDNMVTNMVVDGVSATGGVIADVAVGTAELAGDVLGAVGDALGAIAEGLGDL